ncbi:MAG: chitobiase/beta-hexosaminidase C-terminal domain-containing protein, partial [Verrucomicrobiota bacterium]
MILRIQTGVWALWLLLLVPAPGQPVITELVAINAASLTDGEGKTPDWIEIHNPEAVDLDLSGYHVTDDAEIPDLYTFPPGTTIPGGGYLVVFASGREAPFTDPEGNLHLTFSLNGDGEYLAMHEPGGALIQSFEPGFPRTREDVSYGLGTAAERLELVGPGSTASWLVPTGEIGDDWQQSEFDPAGWQVGEGGIGYGHDGLVPDGGDTRASMWFVNASAYLRFPFEVDDPEAIAALDLLVKFDDGFVAYLNGNRVASDGAPDEADLKFDSTATVQRSDEAVTEARTYRIDRSLLVAGTNVLALHGLNFSASGADSADFLLLPELVGTGGSGQGSYGYFERPSPGEPNGEEPLEGFVEDTKFSHDRGYYTEPFELTITSATPGATILYTTDGSPPTIFTAVTYTEPIAINSTMTIRALATRSGYGPTNIDTQTYLFVDGIIRQEAPAGYPSSWGAGRADYEMDPDIVDDPAYADQFDEAFAAVPTLSLVLSQGALFDRSTGIYQRPDGQGAAWERPVSVEFIVPDGSEPGFQMDAGIRVQGGSSRNTDTPKHSLSLRFRADYGAEKLRYPLFENTPAGETAVDRFDLLQLRPEYNFGWMHRHWYQALYALYGRDQWASDLFNTMGQNGSHGRWVHLFLNGLYWGLYELHERPDAD